MITAATIAKWRRQAGNSVAEPVQDTFDCAMSACESPIEQMMFSGLLCSYGASSTNSRVAFNCYLAIELQMNTLWEALPEPVKADGVLQAWQIWAGYRFTEAIIVQPQLGCRRPDFMILGRHCVLLLECDGFEWHERTSTDAARDRHKDREATRFGFTTLRFLGKELNADLIKCGHDVWSTFWAIEYREECRILESRT